MKSLLMCVLLVVVAVVAFNYWNGVPLLSDPRTARPAAVGTTGTVDVNAAPKWVKRWRWLPPRCAIRRRKRR